MIGPTDCNRMPFLSGWHIFEWKFMQHIPEKVNRMIIEIKEMCEINLYATGSNGWNMLNIWRQAGISSFTFSSAQYSCPFPGKRGKNSS